MSNDAHSPGPWTYDGPPDNIIVWCGPDHRVAFIMTSDGPAEANARLIAAAPDLLASLKRAHEMLEQLGDLPAMRADMAAAIARAEGAQPLGDAWDDENRWKDADGNRFYRKAD
ncbi:MAG: hypothetical protein KGL39_58605 [Patescibacteria group bacterium]|nr:hypothetical protein [Patescibacteria group bacterium]